ncbi:MAG TPA: site-specific tyrosine recombinase XerD [bacterium]|nr:site-specific tyrosine recombinase XerD [bacterium]
MRNVDSPPEPSTKDGPARKSAVFDRWVSRYLDHLVLVAGRSANTLAAYRRDLGRYAAFCVDHGVSDPRAIQPPQVSEFLASLTASGLAPASVARCLSAVKNFHRYLVRQDEAKQNPARPIKTPRLPRKLPDVLSVRQMQLLLEQPGESDPHHLRDRAILATLYGCGLRVSEAAGLAVDDIDFSAGFVRVRGKGNKERLVPFGPSTQRALRRYLDSPARRDADSGARDHVFLSQKGGPLSRMGLWLIVRRYALRAGLGERVHPHTFRHSFATHLIESGADLRAVQLMLGHQSVATTQIYTHLDRQHLRRMHTAYHPLESGFRSRK